MLETIKALHPLVMTYMERSPFDSIIFRPEVQRGGVYGLDMRGRGWEKLASMRRDAAKQLLYDKGPEGQSAKNERFSMGANQFGAAVQTGVTHAAVSLLDRSASADASPPCLADELQAFARACPYRTGSGRILSKGGAAKAQSDPRRRHHHRKARGPTTLVDGQHHKTGGLAW